MKFILHSIAFWMRVMAKTIDLSLKIEHNKNKNGIGK